MTVPESARVADRAYEAQDALTAVATMRHVVFVPVAVELAARLAEGEEFDGTIRLRYVSDRPGEADLLFTPRPVLALAGETLRKGSR